MCLRHRIVVIVVAGAMMSCSKKSENSGTATTDAAQASLRASAGVRVAAGEQALRAGDTPQREGDLKAVSGPVP